MSWAFCLAATASRSKTLKREQSRYLPIRRKTQGEWSCSVIGPAGVVPSRTGSQDSARRRAWTPRTASRLPDAVPGRLALRQCEKHDPGSGPTQGMGVMLETTIAGSLPKPAWLAEPEKLWPAWRHEGAALERAKRDAVLMWLKEQEAAGIDIVSDGEQFRVHFVHGFLEKIEGIDWARKTKMGIRDNRYVVDVPTVTAPIRRRASVAWRRGALHPRLHRTQAEVHAARPDDHLRYHRGRSLWPARGHGDGLRRGFEPGSPRARGGRRRRDPAR